MAEVSVRFIWRDVGAVTVDARGRPTFPPLPAEPGLYRLRLVGSQETSAYIGEASDLRRRAQHYRTPGPTQPTNVRMNARIREHTAGGGNVEVAIITTAQLAIDGHVRPLDLGRKASRLLLESAALHAVPEAEPLENLPGIGDRSS